MSNITIVGDDGNPILFASLTSEGKLRLQFEYFARDDNEGDYEFNYTVEPEEFPKIAHKFGLNPEDPILTVVQQITDMGKGEELSRALSEEEIKRKLWSWLSTP